MDFYKLTIEQAAIGQAGKSFGHHNSAEKTTEPQAVWTTLFGLLNQTYILQKFPQDSPLSALLADPPRSGVESCSVQLLQGCIKPFDAQAMAAGGLHELRCYDLAQGTEPGFVDLLRDILPHRERLSPCLGVWRSVSGRQDQIWHLWAYRDLAERDAVRAKLIVDPVWNAYSMAVIPMIVRQTNFLLNPIPLPDRT